MLANKIENHGTLSAPDGCLGLYAGKQVLVSERPDGRGLSVNVTLPEGSVDNTGKMTADAGTIALHAQVVNQNGIVQANSVRQNRGTIELVASEAINLGANSVLRADGGSMGVSSGGHITIKSDQTFTDNSASVISVRGGTQGGSGGFAEISATQMPSIRSRIDGQANPGEVGGSLLIDPDYITLSTSGADSAPDGTVLAGDHPGESLMLDVTSAFIGFSQITLQAKHNISLTDGTIWNLDTSTARNDSGSLLTLQAGGDIIFNGSSRIQSSGNWSVRMAAGADFASPLSVVRGTGGIYFNGGPVRAEGAMPNGGGSLQTAKGNIQLAAGKEVLIGAGSVLTTGQGNISITTLSGDVNAGTGKDPTGTTAYEWLNQGNYKAIRFVINNIFGIATTGGGNLDINAGGNIISSLPTSGSYDLTHLGNVTLNAGGNVVGQFQVADGLGKITAGGDVGSANSPARLGLIKGSWDVAATHDVILNEVFNPRGAYSGFKGGTEYAYDYALDASVTLNGGNSVQLMGNSPALAKYDAGASPIYPPILDITAGAGGVHIGNDLVLFPSPQGKLQITTTDNGPLHGGGVLKPGDAPQLQPNAVNFAQIFISDSGSSDYTTFQSGHAARPLHAGQTTPTVQLDISGDVQNLYLQSPSASVIAIGGNAKNFSFSGQNLAADDVTRLAIIGDFLTRSLETPVHIDGIPNDSIFDPLDTMMPDLGAGLSYNATTHELSFHGVMTAEQRDFLLHPYVQVIDGGVRVFDTQGRPVTVPATYSTDADAIKNLFAQSQDIPPLQAYSGLQLGGPGKFVISARNMDLGITQGIRSVGVQNNHSLAGISVAGASLSLELSGDLNMISSQIASFNGGDITLTASGNLNIGSQQSFTSDDTSKGIYTGHGGNVYVSAVGDILVSGSRIATYDGGDINVVSQNGTVDAGTGAKGSFHILTTQLNPVTGDLEERNDRFFSSGIVTLTRRDSDAKVGDITVSAARDILASSGGILQLAFNAADQSTAKVSLDAGRNIKANLSGVLGTSVSLKAGGNIEGLIVASQNIVIDSKQNVNVTAIAAGSVNVSAGSGVSGTIVGGGNVNVSGSEVSAAVISTGGNVASSGDSSGAKVGAFSGVAVPGTQQTAQDAEKTVASQSLSQTTNDDDEKKKRPGPVLAKRVGRVTVILPKS